LFLDSLSGNCDLRERCGFMIVVKGSFLDKMTKLALAAVVVWATLFVSSLLT